MPTYKITDHGINNIEHTSIYWRQLIIFNMSYDELKERLGTIHELVEYDLPEELTVTSQLANGEFIPMSDTLQAVWLDKELWQFFNVGYNKTLNKCCIYSFAPGDDKEAKLFIKIAKALPCFYMDGTFAANEMVFLAPRDFKDEVKLAYAIVVDDNNTPEGFRTHRVGQMKSGRYFIDDTLLNADYVRFCLPLSAEDRPEWLRKHTTQELDAETYIIHQTARFIERAKQAKTFTETSV